MKRAASMEDALKPHSIFGKQELVTAEELTHDAQFVALVQRQSRFIFRIAYAVLRNPQDAEDVVQETFLKLYRAGSWRDIRDEPGFLARTAWRIAVGRVNRSRGEQPDLELASLGPNPEKAAMDANWNAILHRLIDALPEDLRQPLALSAIQELESPQIAAIMGIPEGTVRTRIMRARSILKQKLEKYKEGRHAE